MDSESFSASNVSFWLYIIGVVILVWANLSLLMKRRTQVSQDDLYYTALLNLFATCLIVGGWWMKSKECISFKDISAADVFHEKADQSKRSVESFLNKLTGSGSRGSKYSKPYDEALSAADIRGLFAEQDRMNPFGPGLYGF
jgi:hypothetical protein